MCGENMNRGVSLLLVLVVAVPLCIFITQANASENFWINRPPMLNAKSGSEIAVVNGKIYAFGNDGTNEEYDSATLSWTTKQPIPTPRSSFAVAVHQNKIYVIGGNVGYDLSTDLPLLCSLNEVYDPPTDTWESKEPHAHKQEPVKCQRG
jgi:N-acetylneuraminic acid mutarotase